MRLTEFAFIFGLFNQQYSFTTNNYENLSVSYPVFTLTIYRWTVSNLTNYLFFKRNFKCFFYLVLSIGLQKIDSFSE